MIAANGVRANHHLKVARPHPRVGEGVERDRWRGQHVIEVRLGTAAKPPYAVFSTAQGEWKVERTDPFVPPGARRTALRGRWHTLDVIDSSGNVVATMRGSQLTLADGEELTWVYPRSYTTLCGLGNGLWLARAHWPRRRGF